MKGMLLDLANKFNSTDFMQKNLEDSNVRSQELAKDFGRLKEGEINPLVHNAKAFNQGIGMMSDLGMNTLSAVIPDFIEEGASAAFKQLLGSPVLEPIKKVSQPALRAVAELASENPKAAEAVMAFSDAGSTLLGAKAAKGSLNASVRNMDTEVKDFYSGNMLLKLKGVAEGVSTGVGRATQEAFSPSALARNRETGITLGLQKQAGTYLATLDAPKRKPKGYFDEDKAKVTALRKDAAKAFAQSKAKKLEGTQQKEDLLSLVDKNRAEADALESTLRQGRSADAMSKDAEAHAKTYFAGAIDFNKLVAAQEGRKIPLLDKVLGDSRYSAMLPDMVDTGKISSVLMESATNELKGVVRDPAGVASFIKEVPNIVAKTWGIENPANTIVAIKRPVESLANEIRTGGVLNAASANLWKIRNSADGPLTKEALFDKLSQRELNPMNTLMNERVLREVQTGQRFPDPKLAETSAKLKTLPASAKEYKESLSAYKDALKKELKFKQYKGKYENSLKSPPQWDEASQSFFFRGSHLSSAKELGGVNMFGKVGLNGDVVLVLSDKHDMFGLDPIDGKSMMTIVEPVVYNLYDKTSLSRPAPVTNMADLAQSVVRAKGRVTNTDRLQAAQNLGTAGVMGGQALTPNPQQPPQY